MAAIRRCCTPISGNPTSNNTLTAYGRCPKRGWRPMTPDRPEEADPEVVEVIASLWFAAFA